MKAPCETRPLDTTSQQHYRLPILYSYLNGTSHTLPRPQRSIAADALSGCLPRDKQYNGARHDTWRWLWMVAATSLDLLTHSCYLTSASAYVT
ncbi:hypothetical protein E2C01_064289 [Portunus trituberculatus]|uniref:Uncharacterized protein n=1 Tax=Portunus trituberculatus TaxID=210409 RepID=A0A5B7HFT8_PORTR|nr:hypothetical protein [Portunus trituberculatus]